MRGLDIPVPIPVINSFIKRVSWILQWKISLKPLVGFQKIFSSGFNFGLDFLDEGIFRILILFLFDLILNSFVQVGSHFVEDPNHGWKSFSELLFLFELFNVFFGFLFVVGFRWGSGFCLLLVILGFVSDEAFLLFDEHLFEFINNIIVIDITFVFFINGFFIDEYTIWVVEFAFFIWPSSLLIILEKEIVAFKLESDWCSVCIKLFDKVFPSRVWYSTGLHEI